MVVNQLNLLDAYFPLSCLQFTLQMNELPVSLDVTINLGTILVALGYENGIH